MNIEKSFEFHKTGKPYPVKTDKAPAEPGFNLHTLKAELYDEGRAEHSALVAVAEAANKLTSSPHDCIDDRNQDERPSNVRWCPYCITLDALAALAAIRRGGK